MTLPAQAPTIRPARPEDVPAVVAMVHELAEYERAPEQCHLTAEQLTAALFATAPGRGAASDAPSRSSRSPAPALYGHVAVDDRDTPLGFALWFLNFSTWEGVHGIYLEDLYVRPAARGSGAGRLLLATLAAICVERGYRRLDWWMINWNPAAGFYAAIGATAMDEWVPYRLTGPALHGLAAQATAAPTHPAD
ncbi:GNAT family N-acetyltransferase [Micromonospora coerulea]|uniref:GNAT family N-acetyltransferase n=2 Tax=Micromonospora coerulea TaxID=47856 RepID=A0ABP8ST61_9ACTN